ncbi:MOSC domain-containing protein [soil metagenome]
MSEVVALYRHPVKGFTPEPLAEAVLAARGWFPGDRMFAVENGPSGYDPAAPEQIPKQRFTVLMRQAILAQVVTRWDEANNRLHADFDGEALSLDLTDDGDRTTFADRLAGFLGEEARGPLRLIDAGPAHRFMDSSRGRVSILNLASVRDLSERLGFAVDPLRFRANVWVEGWPAWLENDMPGQALVVGPLILKGDKPIVRCAATEVDPATGLRDLKVVSALFDHYGHTLCGLYCSIEADGRIAVGDRFTRRS